MKGKGKNTASSPVSSEAKRKGKEKDKEHKKSKKDKKKKKKAAKSVKRSAFDDLGGKDKSNSCGLSAAVTAVKRSNKSSQEVLIFDE
jgi:hypothetical protein